MAEYNQIPTDLINLKIKNRINFTKISFKKLITIIIISTILLLFYSCCNQHGIKNNIKNNVNITLADSIKINKNNKISKELYTQMTLVQKLFYYRSLFGYNTKEHVEQKLLLDKKIIKHLSYEYQIYKNYNNSQQLLLLSEKIKLKLDILQNPNNCSNVKILVCPIDAPNWGIGFLLHQICYCFISAIESGRTMILNNENIKLFKFDVKWNEVFKSISNCSYIEHVQPFLPLKEYFNKEQTDRITIFKIKDGMLRRREIDSVPLEIKNFILKYHSNPIIWFYGQLLNYIWKENEKTLNLTNKIVSKIPFECGPIVGIHVRRTDKIKEAKLYELEEYMKWVDFWFDINEENYKNTNLINLNCTNKRMLFVAADIPVLKNVIEEIKNKWGNKYEIYHGTIFKNETQYKSREALIEILDIFRILAKCQFLTCQLIYELMQVFQGDASENVHSLDYLYGLGRKLEATTDYKPNHEHPIMPEELWAEKGDIILALSSVHNDGLIRAKNIDSNKEGYFPMYFLKKHTNFQHFLAFDNFTL